MNDANAGVNAQIRAGMRGHAANVGAESDKPATPAAVQRVKFATHELSEAIDANDPDRVDRADAALTAAIENAATSSEPTGRTHRSWGQGSGGAAMRSERDMNIIIRTAGR